MSAIASFSTVAVAAPTTATRSNVAKRAARFSASKAVAATPVIGSRKVARKSVRGGAVKVNASMVEVAQIANQGAEIASIATTCFAITLVGLAIGFVLLRVEGSVVGEE